MCKHSGYYALEKSNQIVLKDKKKDLEDKWTALI